MEPNPNSVGEYFPIQLDITNVCNLNCGHCYHQHHRNDGALDLNGWHSVLTQYKSFLSKYSYKPLIILCGGEPTLSHHFGPILDFLGDIFSEHLEKLKMLLITNGTRPDKIPFEKLEKFDVTIQISFDGHNSLSHDSVRGNGSFERTLVGIDQIQKNFIPLSILTILSRRTSQFIPEMFDFCESLGIGYLGFTRLIGVGNATSLRSSGQDDVLSPNELKSAYMRIVIESSRTSVQTSTNSPLFATLSPELGSKSEFWKGFVVDYRGKVLLSSRSRIAIGHAVLDGLETVWSQNTILKKLREGKIEICGTCNFLKSCGGDRNAAFAAYGDFLGTDPGCWLTKIEEEKVS